MVATHLSVMALALILDAIIGDPAWLYRRIPHPVVWMGKLLHALDGVLNKENASPGNTLLRGGLALAILLALFAGGAWLIQEMLAGTWWGLVLTGLLSSTLLAQRSLHDHVRAVATPLALHNLPAARAALRNIVGRDVTPLDDAGIAAAAIESLAENLSDGVIAPLFWGCLLGLPGIAAYKAINTADSMIGHRTPRHLYFGRIAARVDDIANLLPARLTSVLIVIVSGSARAMRIMLRDARKHRSPNAGWPEAAMAGALDVRLSGPRSYHGVPTPEPWLNVDGGAPSAASLNQALGVMLGVCTLTIALAVAGAALFQR